MSDSDRTVGPQRLTGKTVLVTGAGTGLGAELAVRAAREGAATVGIGYRSSAQGAQRTSQRVSDAGAEAFLVQGDLQDWGSIRRMADETMAQVGTLDVLVNNAGDVATEQMSWREITEEGVTRVLEVDVKGLIGMHQEFGRRMLDQGHGAIVNIGSTVVVDGSPRAPQYAASKYALIGLTKSYARAFAPTVRVNAFAPGFMRTEATLARADWQSGRREELEARTPAGIIPAPEELAGAALFLATDDAAHFVGSFLICDGGKSMVGA